MSHGRKSGTNGAVCHLESKKGGLVPEGSDLHGDVEISDVVEIFGPFKARGDCKLHTGVILCGDNELGFSVIVGPDTIVGEGSKIGNDSTLGAGCTVDNDVIIEDDVHIGDGVHLKTSVHVRSRAAIGTILGGTVVGVAADVGEGADIQGTKNIVKDGQLVEVDMVEAGAIVPQSRKLPHEISDSEWSGCISPQVA